MCDRVLRDVCTRVLEVLLLLGGAGGSAATAVVVAAPRARAGSGASHVGVQPSRRPWGWRGGSAVEWPLLTVLLSSPDADRVDSTTLFGKAHLGFCQPVFCLRVPVFSCSYL